MVEIKEGPELDRAVAEATGMVYEKQTGWWDGDEYIGFASPSNYSTDLNAAFAAAEKVGLFDENRLYRDKRTGQYGLDPTNIMSGRLFPMAPAPALAICAAILKLKET